MSVKREAENLPERGTERSDMTNKAVRDLVSDNA